MEPVEYREMSGFIGYRVGSDGTVWSRRVGGGCTSGRLRNEWRRLSVSYSPRKAGGYRAICVTLTGAEGLRQISVAHLILETFVGPCPEGMQACHFPDPDPRNNRLDNLRWDTPTGNQRDRELHGRTPRGEKNGNAKLTTEKVLAIRAMRQAGATLDQTALAHGVGRSTVRRIVLGETWKHLLQERR